MGADIHMVAEKRVDNTWVGANAFHDLLTLRESSLFGLRPGRVVGARPLAVERNYLLFAAIAGVRGESRSGLAPRGIPPDASPLSRLMMEAWPDGHSHSWLGLPEAMPHFIEHVTQPTDYPGLSERDRVTDLAKLLFGTDDDMQDWRLVFWFDN